MEDYSDLHLIFEDYIPVKCFNILGEPPNFRKTLYGINEQYFRTIDDLIDYCIKMGFSNEYVNFCSFKVTYLKKYGGYNDVFLKTFCKNLENPLRNSYSLLMTVISAEEYGVYNYNESIYYNKNIWRIVEGSLRSMCMAFKNKGINYIDDIYFKTDVRNEKVYKKIRR